MKTRAFTGILSASDTRDMDAVEDALSRYGSDVRARFESAAQQQLTDAWKQEITAATGVTEQQKSIVGASPLLAVATAKAGIGVVVATGGDGRLGFLTRAFEFGAVDRTEKVTYQRRNPKASGSHSVTRATKMQLPSRSQTGWLA